MDFPYAQYAQLPGSRDFAYCANSAYRDAESPRGVDGLLDALEIVCKDLPITPAAVLSALAPEDKADWHSGKLPPDTLRDFAWCWNRAADKPIPRPCSVHCGDCIHFERSTIPTLGTVNFPNDFG